MRNLILKLHIYAGLLTFTQIALYGVAGLVATFQQGAERPKVAHTIRHVPFTAGQSMTDKQVADEVYRTLELPLSRPMPAWFLRRTPENDLLLDFYNINGIWRVVVLERENRLRIEEIRNSLGLFLGDMHAITTGDAQAPPSSARGRSITSSRCGACSRSAPPACIYGSRRRRAPGGPGRRSRAAQSPSSALWMWFR